MSEHRDAALDYATRGWRVFPLRPGRKEPGTARGFKDASADPEQIERWWESEPEAGVGIATGGVSRLVVVDVDPRHGGNDALAELEARWGELPETVRAETGGGGEHYYFTHPGGEIRCSAGGLGDGLDVKAGGGYVVAPPSGHPDGGAYTWDAPPDETPLAIPPEWLSDLMRDAHARRNGHGTAELPDTIPEGGRNDRLYRWACKLRGQGGMSESEIRDALEVASRNRCKPPLDADELARIAASAASHEREVAVKSPASFDPETGEALSALDQLNRAVAWEALQQPVRFLRVRKIGAQRSRWVLTVRSYRTEEPYELESLTTKQLRTLNNLAERVDEADAGELPTPQQNSEKWRPIWRAIKAAAEFEEHGATEVGGWRRRLALYLHDNVSLLDPTSPDEKRVAIEGGHEAFSSPDGRLWVHSGAWLDALARGKIDADEASVSSALRQLGFTPEQLTAKIDGRNRTRRYWRSPEGFDWKDEADAR